MVRVVGSLSHATIRDPSSTQDDIANNSGWGFEPHHRKWRQRRRDRLRKAAPFDRLPPAPARVAHVAAAIIFGIGVEHLAIKSRARNSDAIRGAWHGRKVADANHRAAARRGTSTKE